MTTRLVWVYVIKRTNPGRLQFFTWQNMTFIGIINTFIDTFRHAHGYAPTTSRWEEGIVNTEAKRSFATLAMQKKSQFARKIVNEKDRNQIKKSEKLCWKKLFAKCKELFEKILDLSWKITATKTSYFYRMKFINNPWKLETIYREATQCDKLWVETC